MMSSNPTEIASQCVSQLELLRNVLTQLNNAIDDDTREEMTASSLSLELDASVVSMLMSTSSVMDIYNVLLGQFNNNLHQLALTMNKFFTVKDEHQLSADLKKLCYWIESGFEYVGLTPDSKMYGRDNEMKKLLSYLDFEKDVDTRLINVCGMAGMGKSYLVKHLALKLRNAGEVAVIYIDVSQKKEETMGEILIGNSEITNYLLEKSGNKIVLILDDISSHMSKACRASELMKILNSFFVDVKKKVHGSKKNRGVPIKVVVTSHEHFTQSSERKSKAEPQELTEIKSLMKDYTKDLPLDRLDNECALEFLNESLHQLSETLKKRLIDHCSGHPYLLSLLKEKAKYDFNLTAEIVNLTELDLKADGAILTKLFPAEFKGLTEFQKRVLLTVAMFDQDISFKALYQIIQQDCSSNIFYGQVIEAFKNGFWLRIKKAKATRDTVAGVHHPLIMQFLRSEINSYLELPEDCEQHKEIVKLKENSIRYNIQELVDMGKALVASPAAPDQQVLKEITDHFQRNKASFKQMTIDIANSPHPTKLLFTTDGQILRPVCEITHLFLCFHEFCDGFGGFLLDMLQEAVLKPTDSPIYRVLLWTLYLLVLCEDKNYRALQDIIENPRQDKDPKLLLSESPPPVYHFCKALHHYVTGLYLTRAPWLKEKYDPDLFEKREKELGAAQKALSLSYLPPEWINVRRYFIVKVYSIQAEAHKQTKPRSPEVIDAAFKIVRSAKKEMADKITVLESSIYSNMAEMRFLGACELFRKQIYGKSRYQFEECLEYHQKALDGFKARNLERSACGGHAMLAYANVLRSFGVLLADKMDKLEDAIAILKKALEVGRKAIRIHEVLALGTTSKRLLYRAYEDHAVCHVNQAKFYGRMNDRISMIEKKKHTKEAFTAYNRAYNIIFSNYRSCQFTANDVTLSRLLEHFPQLMNAMGIPDIQQDKVIANLLDVQQNAYKEGHKEIEFRGSELDSYSSSDRESSDEDIVSTKPASYPVPTQETGDMATTSKRIKN